MAALVAALLSACAAVPIEPAVVGYTCCNLRLIDGWISSNNIQGGTLIPAGEPVRLTSIKRHYYVYGTIGDNEAGLRDDGAKTEADTMQWLRQVVVAEDPRQQLTTWPADVRLAVRSGKVVLGMTRAQVLVSLGHPSRVDTPDLGAAIWRYWTALDDLPVDLQFGDDDKLARLSGKASAVRAVELGL